MKKNASMMLALLLCLVSICVLVLFGFADGRETAGKTVLAATLPVGSSVAEDDAQQLEQQVCDLLGTKAALGFTTNYGTGLTDLIITLVPVTEVDEAAVLDLVNTAHPEWELTAFDTAHLSGSIQSGDIWKALIAVYAVALAVSVLFELAAGGDNRAAHIAVRAVVLAACELFSQALAAVAHIALSWWLAAVASASACVSTALCSRILQNYDRLLQSGKKADRKLAAARSAALGWKYTCFACVFAVLLGAAGFCASTVLGISPEIASFAWISAVPAAAVMTQLLSTELYTNMLA